LGSYQDQAASAEPVIEGLVITVEEFPPQTDSGRRQGNDSKEQSFECLQQGQRLS